MVRASLLCRVSSLTDEASGMGTYEAAGFSSEISGSSVQVIRYLRVHAASRGAEVMPSQMIIFAICSY